MQLFPGRPAITQSFAFSIRQGIAAAMLLGMSTAALAVANVNEVYGTYNGFWHATGPDPANASNGRNDLLAFRADGVLYSTGVNDALLTSNSVSFTAAHFMAFNPDPAKVPEDGGLNALPLADTYDPEKTRASYLFDGEHGLDLNTALFNVPPTDLTFHATIANASVISDNVPDVVVTQVGQPSATKPDYFYFINADGDVVGDKLSIVFRPDNVPSTGTQTWQFWHPDDTENVGLRGTRDLRMRAYHLSDFGITADNFAQVAGFVQHLSGESDVATVAYNQQAVLVPASLEVTKDNYLSQVDAGETVSYVVTITNNGGVTATGVSWTDTFSNLLVNSITANPPDDPGANAGICTGMTCSGIVLPGGASVSYEVEATVTGSYGSTASNTATATGGGCPTDLPTSGEVTAVCSATDADPIEPPDSVLTVTKTDYHEEALKDSRIIYHVTITNNSAVAIQGASWTDTFSGLTIDSITLFKRFRADGSEPICTTSGCTNMSIEPGGSITFAVAATITGNAGTDAVNTATAIGGGCVTGDEEGCSATDTDQITEPSLTVTKTNNADSVAEGRTVVYTVTITNNGTAMAHNVNWTDTSVEGLTISSIDVAQADGAGSEGGTCTAAGCTDASIAKGGSVSYTVRAQVSGTAGGNAVNTASVTGGDCSAQQPAEKCTTTDTDVIVPAPITTTAPVPVDSPAVLALLSLILAVFGWRAMRTRQG